MRFIYYLQLTYVVRLLTLMTIHSPTHTTAVFVPYMLHRIYLSINISALGVLLLVDLRKSCRWQNVSMCRPTQVWRFKNVCFPFVGLRWRQLAGQIPAFTLTVTQWSPCELGLSHCAPNFKMHSRDTRRFGSHRSSAVWDVIPLYQQSQRSFVNTP